MRPGKEGLCAQAPPLKGLRASKLQLLFQFVMSFSIHPTSAWLLALDLAYGPYEEQVHRITCTLKLNM